MSPKNAGVITCSAKQRGFTLVEILIVVIILGILAAIVVPQFTLASTNATEASMQQQLQMLRSQIQVYRAQHVDRLPDLTSSWDQFVYCTDINGAVKTTEPRMLPDATYRFGPYVHRAVQNPITNSAALATSAAEGIGWVYHETTGQIYGVGKDDSGNYFRTNDGKSVVP